MEENKSTINPRWKSGKRRKYQQRFKAMQAECGICHGRLGPIRYDQPSDGKHPLSFCIDEIIPVKYWREAGYESPAACSDDVNNIQAAHRICNAQKGSKLNYHPGAGEPPKKKKNIILDGQW